MTANSSLNREEVLASRTMLRPVRESKRLGGFGNMLDKELGEWFNTRRWLVQTIIWLAILNGLLTFVLFVAPKIDPNALNGPTGAPPGREEIFVMGMTLFFSMSAVAGVIGMIILAQDEVIREKQSGTAAWILSKPVSRSSFILTKVLSNLVGGLIFILAIPAIITYMEVNLATGSPAPVLPYLMACVVILLTLIFYLTLVVMLGVLFEQRGPVLGIAFGLMFGGLILSSFIPQLGYVLPLNMDKIALAIIQSKALPAAAISEIISSAALSIIFIIVAVWRFGREEL